MVEQLMIARLGSRGDGIADTAAGTIYVPYALPGETAEVERWPGHPDRRQLIKIDVASPDRIAPICPHFGICGGCALQHLATARYRDWKRALVAAALARAGLDTPVDELIDAHGEGRRRAVFHARVSARDVIEVGFSALKAHHVVAIDRCPILAPGLAGAIEAAWAIAEALAATHKPLDIQVTATDAGLDVDVVTSSAARWCRLSSNSSTPWYLIRRGKAPRRRRASWRHRSCRRWLQSPAIPRPSRATPASWSTAVIAWCA